MTSPNPTPGGNEITITNHWGTGWSTSTSLDRILPVSTRDQFKLGIDPSTYTLEIFPQIPNFPLKSASRMGKMWGLPYYFIRKRDPWH
jgi:hypothetical protein